MIEWVFIIRTCASELAVNISNDIIETVVAKRPSDGQIQEILARTNEPSKHIPTRTCVDAACQSAGAGSKRLGFGHVCSPRLKGLADYRGVAVFELK